ncbi:type I polyketide synthase [Microbulbifer aggregans]|uniref:type I polyketide synthase n=1 Tax=Microbulbifer aggregans TaxID=1769779 RepID=UPI001CFD34C5|nr:type I polyketide synthase [Microbulbifer aggregans]
MKDSAVKSTDIAIIGLSCRLPGGNNSPEEFYEFLLNGGDGIVDVPADRWDSEAYYDTDREKVGKMFVNQGGFITGLDQFDPQFFGISPKEAPHIDPQHRWLLELTQELIENSGLKSSDLKGSDTAVYIGQFMHDYEQIQLDPMAHENISSHSATGPSMTLTSNRISYAYDFTGPSITLDTACSSSLVALDLACKAVLNGDSRYAIAGGVNILLRPELTVSICKASMLSPDCRCKSFDASANGYVRSEGAGLVMVKRLSDAISDNDNILAVIKASGANQDGHTVGITVPNGESQKKLLTKTLSFAEIPAHAIQYAEAHGTGTAVGDPIEVNALGSLLGQDTARVSRCAIGSVKSNIGHTEAAAGVAGLIKTVMSMKHGVIPGNIHFNQVNPEINPETLNIDILAKNTPWPDIAGEKRRAIVNSFGFGGTNANVVIEQAPVKADEHCCQSSLANGDFHLLPVSAKTEKGLKDQAEKWIDYLLDSEDREDAADLQDICYTAANKREHFKYRLIASGKSKQELVMALEDFLAGSASANYASGSVNTDDGKRVCFTFSGMGTTWAKMGLELYRQEPVYKTAIDRCSEALKQYSGWSLVDELYNSEDPDRIHTTFIAQPAIFASQYALAELMASWGVKPDAVVGHSAGEVAAAYVAGALSFDDAIKVIYHRSSLQHTTEGLGKMLAVALTEEELKPYLSGIEDKVSIAAINSEEALTLAGDEAELEKISEKLDQEGIFARFLKVAVPYHSPVMDRLKTPLIDALKDIKPQKPHTPLYSTVTGELAKEGDFGCEYWPENVREPVLFKRAIERIAKDGYGTFLEIAPHAALASSISKNIERNMNSGGVVTTLKRDQDDALMAVMAIAGLQSVGYDIDWEVLYPQASAKVVPIPNYAWQHARYWHETEDVAASRLKNVRKQGGFDAPVHELLGAPLNSTALIWHSSIDLQQQTYLRGHKVEGEPVFPGAAYIEMALRAGKDLVSSDAVSLKQVEFKRALFLNDSAATLVETHLDQNSGRYAIRVQDNDDRQWRIFSDGQVHDAPDSVADEAPIDLPKLIASMESEYNKDDFYQHCRALGLHYEEEFQAVQRCWFDKDSSLVEIMPSDSVLKSSEDYLLHPCILDSAFQGLFPTIESGYLPVAIERLNYLKAPSGRCYGYLTSRSRSESEIVGDVALLDESGDLLVKISGITLKASNMQERLQGSNDLCYDYLWQALEVDEGADTSTANWLVLRGSSTRAVEIEDYLRTRWDNVETIVFDPDNLQDGLTQLPQYAKRTSHIFNLLALDFVGDSLDYQQVLSQSQVTLKLAQAISEIEWAHQTALIFATENAQGVIAADRNMAPAQAAVWGFARVFGSEFPDFKVTLADLDRAPIDNSLAALAEWLAGPGYEQEVACRNGDLYANRLRQLTPAVMQSNCDSLTELREDEQFSLDTRDGNNGLLAVREPQLTPGDGELVIRVETFAIDAGTSGRPVYGVIGQVTGSLDPQFLGERVYALTEQAPRSQLLVDAERTVPWQGDAIQSVGLTSSLLAAHVIELLRTDSNRASIFVTGDWDAFTRGLSRFAEESGINICFCSHHAEHLAQARAENVFAVSADDPDLVREARQSNGGNGYQAVVFRGDFDARDKALELLEEGGRWLDVAAKPEQLPEDLFAILCDKSAIYHPISLRALVQKPVETFRKQLDDSLTARAGLVPVTNEISVLGALEHGYLPDSLVTFSDRPETAISRINSEVIRPDVTYLVTGGLGGLGLEIMHWLAAGGATSVVLIGRSAPKPEALVEIEQVRSAGVAISVMQADVCRLDDIEQVVASIRRDLPPLAGVIHSAGVLADGTIPQQSDEQFDRVLQPKVLGTYNLHQATAHLTLDMFVCFSSIAAIVGWAGQCNYAAANAFMDSFCHWRQRQGFAALSVNWGPWANAGMAANLDARDIQRMEDAGMAALTTDQGMGAMEQLLRYRLPQGGVFNLDWGRILKQFPEPAKKTVFSEFFNPEEAQTAIDYRSVLTKLGAEEKTQLLIQLSREIFADVLGLDSPEAIEPTGNVFEYGLNSLMAMEFKNRMQTALGMKLPGTLVAKYSSAKALAGHLVEEFLTDATEFKAADQSQTGEIPWLPSRYSVYHNLLDGCDNKELNHWTKSFVRALSRDFDLQVFMRALDDVLAVNDGLRVVNDIDQQYGSATIVEITAKDIVEAVTLVNLKEEALYAEWIRDVNLHTSPMKIKIIESEDSGDKVLLLMFHQLLMDGMSAMQFLSQIVESYDAQVKGESARLFGGSLFEYSHKLAEYANTENCIDKVKGILASGWQDVEPLSTDSPLNSGNNRYGNGRTEVLKITRQRKANVDESRSAILEIARAISSWSGVRKLQFDLQHHGRRQDAVLPDASNTIGYFTEDYPVLLDTSRDDCAEQLARSMNANSEYGVLKFMCGDEHVREQMKAISPSQVAINIVPSTSEDHLRQDGKLFDVRNDEWAFGQWFDSEVSGRYWASEALNRQVLFYFEVYIREDTYDVYMNYNSEVYKPDSIDHLKAAISENLGGTAVEANRPAHKEKV